MTSGDVLVESFPLMSHPDEAKDRIGYCPQTFDAIDPFLSAQEHLLYYSLIRGVPMNVQDEVSKT